jgi:hypothetical protein
VAATEKAALAREPLADLRESGLAVTPPRQRMAEPPTMLHLDVPPTFV